MALTANREVDRFVDQELRQVALAGGVQVFKGGLVEWNVGGFAGPVVGGGTFVGLAYEEVDNRGGGDGDKAVRVYTLGDFDLPLAGATQADMGRAVYATDDATLTFNAQDATYVGRVVGLSGAGRIVLRLQTVGMGA